MRLFLLLIFISMIPMAQADFVVGEEKVKDCHMHKTWPIHFRNFQYKDVLELSVSPGPCETALMTLIIRSEFGDIYYMYAARFAPHVTFDTEDPNFDKFIEPYLKHMHTHAQKNTKMLPKYFKQDAANKLIKLHVSLKEYNKLRIQHLPLFYHLSNYDTWQYVLYDKKAKKWKKIVSGKLIN